MRVKSVAERNAAYAAMSKVQRRKAVAADALAQLRARKYTAVTGQYEVLLLRDGEVGSGGNVSSIEGALPETVRCECCAKGALMISAVRCFDAAPVKRCYPGYRTQVLAEIFGERSADLAEDTFEGANCNGALSAGEAQRFVRAFPRDRSRLMQILLLILAHPKGLLTRRALMAAAEKPLSLREAQP